MAKVTSSLPESPRLIGSAYVSALRSSLLAPENAKAAWDAKVDQLAASFRLERRIVAAVRVQSEDPLMKTIAEAIEKELASQLGVVGLRDFEIVDAKSLAASVGWKRVLFDGRAEPATALEGQIKIELVLRDSDRAAEKPLEEKWVESINTDSSGDVRGAKLQDAAERLVQRAILRLDHLRAAQFDEGRRLAREGQKSRAVEEYLGFLFSTPDCDTPLAEQANEYVAGVLKFSVLDWVWGEPNVAAWDLHRPTRRLPLGFRPVAGASAQDELPSTIICLRDSAEMVLVPGGDEAMGNDTGSPDERPAHPVSLTPFYIDKLETSVGQYERFLAATGHRTPQPDDTTGPLQWNRRASKADMVQVPVVHVSWHDATAYSQWAGKSLPSEAQWERAARGRFAADYPRPLDPAFSRHVNAGRAGGGLRELMSVYSFPTAINPFGCQNMLGNVAEWCRDWYDAAYYAESPSHEPLGPDFGERRVVRGGSWQTPIQELSPSRRDREEPTVRKASIGFRCILNISSNN